MVEKEPFALLITSGFTEDGEWLIDICVERPEQGSGKEMDLGGLRVAALQAIAAEGRRGRSLGAERVRVHLDQSILGLDESLGSLTDTVH